VTSFKPSSLIRQSAYGDEHEGILDWPHCIQAL